jgi:hypothetical protein
LRLEARLGRNQLFHLIDGEKAAAHVESAHPRVFAYQFGPKPGMLLEESGATLYLTGSHYLL